MCSKIETLILCLLATFLLISSNVAARDLAEVFSNSKEAEDVVKETKELVSDAKYPVHRDHVGNYPYYDGFPGQGGGFGGGFGYGYLGGGGGGYGGYGGFPWQGGHGRRGYCQFGCCSGAFMGGCKRCCRFPRELVVTQTYKVKPHN